MAVCLVLTAEKMASLVYAHWYIRLSHHGRVPVEHAQQNINNNN